MSGSQKQQQSKQTQVKSTVKKDSPKAAQNVNLEQLVAAPETMRSEEILAAQQQVGNQVVQRALDGKKKRDAMTDEQGYLNDKINSDIQQKRGGGSPLPESVRNDAGKHLNQDFGNVRIHTDEKADELSQSINARAFTIGKDIFFKKGVFSPASREGRETLMHELTHVVQQSKSGKSSGGRLKLGGPDTAHEKQADKIGKANSGMGAIKSSAPAVQKMGEEEEEALQMQEEEEIQMQRERVPVALRPPELADGDEEKRNKLLREVQGFDKGALKAPGRRPVADDDAVQMQPDSVVQREEMPEEELMMQEEEEELQMQPDSGVVQREEMPEDELMMQEEEEELQMQPDTGVVQRDKDKRKGMMLSPEDEEKLHGQIKAEDKKSKRKGMALSPEDQAKLHSQIEAEDKKSKRKGMVLSPEDQKELHSQLEAEEKTPSKQEKMSPEEAHKEMVRQANKNDKKMSPEDAHKEMVKQANKDDEKKPSKWSRFKGGAKKTGGYLAGLGDRFIGKAVDDMSEQLFGKKEEKEKPKDEAKPSPVTVNLGGGGGSLAMVEKIEKYRDQIEQLKEELRKEKEKKSANV